MKDFEIDSLVKSTDSGLLGVIIRILEPNRFAVDWQDDTIGLVSSDRLVHIEETELRHLLTEHTFKKFGANPKIKDLLLRAKSKR